MKRVVLLAAVFLAVGVSEAQAAHLSYWDGRRAIVAYSHSGSGIGRWFSIVRCDRQRPGRVACLLRWPHVHGWNELGPNGWTPVYSNYEGWTVASQRRGCVEVWYVDLVKELARCL